MRKTDIFARMYIKGEGGRSIFLTCFCFPEGGAGKGDRKGDRHLFPFGRVSGGLRFQPVHSSQWIVGGWPNPERS